MLCASCSTSTWKTYESQYKKFLAYCSVQDIDIINLTIVDILEYLTHLFQSNLSYSSVNTARSSLSLLLPKFESFKIGEHPLIVRLMKGIFKKRPPLPKYKNCWDVNVVLDFLRKLPDNSNLDLLMLSIKLVGLLALISGQRVQTLASIKIENVKSVKNSTRIFVPQILKTSKINSSQPCIVLPLLSRDKKLCVKSTLEHYLDRTITLRKDSNLLISSKKPHNKVSPQTISKWLLKLLSLSNIDIDVFQSHSFRHSSTSKAYSKGVNIDSIFCNAGWSEKSLVFAKFYNKPCMNSNEFANSVLNK